MDRIFHQIFQRPVIVDESVPSVQLEQTTACLRDVLGLPDVNVLKVLIVGKQHDIESGNLVMRGCMAYFAFRPLKELPSKDENLLKQHREIQLYRNDQKFELDQELIGKKYGRKIQNTSASTKSAESDQSSSEEDNRQADSFELVRIIPLESDVVRELIRRQSFFKHEFEKVKEKISADPRFQKPPKMNLLIKTDQVFLERMHETIMAEIDLQQKILQKRIKSNHRYHWVTKLSEPPRSKRDESNLMPSQHLLSIQTTLGQPSGQERN